MTFLDRIKETSTSTGTGTFTLGGAVLGYKVFSNGTYKYCIVNDTESEWEVGEGTVASGVLTRTTIEASSNGGAIVSFSAGTKQVFNTVSAAYVNSLVPYTGATASVNLGEYGLTAGQLTLDTSPTGTAVVGTTRWNDTIGSSETLLKGGNVLLKNGVDLVARVVNKVTPATTLTKAAYKAVRVSGAQGQRLAVAYAQANNDNNSADTIGLVCETIAQNQEGFIITVGQLLDVNTTGSLQGETWADGDVLYLSPTTAGNLTNIKPTGATGHIVIIGYVEYAHANNGKIYVKVMNGWELTELHDTYISSVANNDVLTYESASDLWKNKSIATILGYTPQAQLNGTGFVKATGTTISYDNSTYALDSLVMKLAGSQTATGYKTFSIGLQTTTGDNYLNYTSDNTHIGYSAAPSAPLKLNVKSSVRVEYTANRYVDIKVNPSLSDYAYIQASNTTGFSIVSSGTLFLRPNDASNTIYLGSFVRQQDITASALYGSTSLTGRGFEIGTNVPMVFKTTIDAGGGVVGGFIFHGSDNANFAHRVTASTTSLHTIKTTGQLQLHNYTSTSVFTGTVAGLLGFDSSGNVITTSASGGGISGSGTAGQVTYWTGTSAVGGSSNLFWDNTNGRLGIGTGSPATPLDVIKNQNAETSLNVRNTTSGTASVAAVYCISNTAAGTIQFGKQSSTTTTYKILSPSDGYLFNNIAGDISIMNDWASGRIKFAAGGSTTSQMTLFANGNLTINNGTTDGNYRLDINGTGASTGALRVTGGNVQFGSATGLNWDNTNGRLGIGTSSPDYIFTINGNLSATFKLNVSGLSTDIISNGTLAPHFLTDFIWYYGVPGSGVNKMRLYGSTGNLDLGSGTDAGYKLDINGTLRIRGNTIDIPSNSAVMKFGSTNYTRFEAKSDGALGVVVNGNTKFFIGASTNSSIEIPSSYSIAFVNPNVTTFANINWSTTSSAFELTNGGKTAFVDLKIKQLIASDKITTSASTTTSASLRVLSGTAPTSPNDGDIWYDGTNIFIRVGGSTKTFTIV